MSAVYGRGKRFRNPAYVRENQDFTDERRLALEEYHSTGYDESGKRLPLGENRVRMLDFAFVKRNNLNNHRNVWTDQSKR